MTLERLNSKERYWINYIRDNVVSKLLGSAAQRAQTAAIVTWWSLKEGILDLPNPISHNLCHFSSGDRPIGNLDVCPGQIWQIGISGIQGNAVTLNQVEQLSRQIYPNLSIEQILSNTAILANVDSNTALQIQNSTGNLRKSWLLRDPAISFTLQRPFVEQGCLNRQASWCFGNWDSARRFASDKSTIFSTINELSKEFSGSESQSIFPWLLLAGSLGAIGYTVAKQRHWI